MPFGSWTTTLLSAFGIVSEAADRGMVKNQFKQIGVGDLGNELVAMRALDVLDAKAGFHDIFVHLVDLVRNSGEILLS